VIQETTIKTNRLEKLPSVVWKLLKLPAQVPYALGMGTLQGKLVLLLTTMGRKSGKPRVTPLQFEEVDGLFVVSSARGIKADWVKNIQANPEVSMRVKNCCYRGLAKVVTNTARVADFLELRLSRHPKMVGAIMRLEGLSSKPTRAQLKAYAAGRAIVIICPIERKEVLESYDRTNIGRSMKVQVSP
jgi:deazaflavin-dependent oxidoreductase (nitroreductase family)